MKDKRYERVSLYITPILSMFSCGCKYTHDRSCTLIGCRRTEPLPLAVRRLLLIGLLFTLCSLALALACRPAVKIETVHTQHTDTDGTAPLVVMIHNSDNRGIKHTQYKHKHTFLKLNAEQEKKKIVSKIGLLVVSHKYIAYWKEQIWAFSSTNTAQTNSGM